MQVSRSLVVASLALIPFHAAIAQTNPATPRANPGIVGESLNNSNPNPALNPSVSGTSSLPNAPGTNSAGTAQSSGSSPNSGAGVTTGSAGSRTGGIDAQGPNKTGDAVRAEDATIDKKIKSICRGC